MRISDHLSEDEIELYSLRRMREPELRRVEEHLQRCEWCRALVKQTDLFHEVIQEVLSDLHGAEITARVESGPAEPLSSDAPRFMLCARRTFLPAAAQNRSRPYTTVAVVARLPFENGCVPLMIRAMTVFGFEGAIGLTIWANSPVVGG